MATFELSLITDNAAFAEDYHGEMRRIFEHVLQRLDGREGPFMRNKYNNVRDINGNLVGTFRVTDDDL